jgi:hypothetical protein
MIVIYRVEDDDWQRKEFQDRYLDSDVAELLAEEYHKRDPVSRNYGITVDIVHRCHYKRYTVEVEYTPYYTAYEVPRKKNEAT